MVKLRSRREGFSKARHKRKPHGVSPTHCCLTTLPFCSPLGPGFERQARAKWLQKSAIRLLQSPCLLINVYLHDNERGTIRPHWLRPSFLPCFMPKIFPGAFFLLVFPMCLSLRPAVWIVLNVLYSGNSLTGTLRGTSCRSKNQDQRRRRQQYLHGNRPMTASVSWGDGVEL